MSEYDPYRPNWTEEEVKLYREKTGCGLMEAISVIKRNQVIEDFDDALYNENSGLDIFEVIRYALFQMKGKNG